MSDNLDLHFSEMEKKVINELKQGITNREIAKNLNFSVYTIKYYVAKIISKTKAANRLNAIYILCQNGYFKQNEQDF